MKVRGIIWYNSCFENALEQLNQIIKNYEYYKCNHINLRTSKFGTYVEFENGDIWQIRKATDNSRACRGNIAYIERSIDYNTYRTIVLPCLKPYPFSAFYLWGEGNLHITDEVKKDL